LSTSYNERLCNGRRKDCGVQRSDRKAIADGRELAQVLAHEIGHALAGHTREKISISMGTEFALAAYGATAAANEKTQQALTAAALVAIQLPNSRHMESEADRIGIEVAARAGYNPNAAVSLWQKMARLQSGSPPEFLSTHPSDETRLRALSGLAPQMMPIYQTARH
jgi:predicted Zn-dependent protease